MTHMYTLALLAAFALPLGAYAQDAEPDMPQEPATTTTPPATNTPTTSPGQPRDPNTVLGGTTTFPKGQKVPVPGVQQGPLSDWDGLYAEASIGTFNTAESTGGVTGRIGFQTRRIVGFEAEYSTALSDFVQGRVFGDGFVDDDGARLPPTAIRTAEVDSVVAGFVRARFPIDDRIGLFARVGYHQTDAGFSDALFTRDEDGRIIVEDNQLTFSGETDEFEQSYDGLATGLGAEISINETFGARVEFSRYEVGDDLTLNYISIGGQVRF